VNELNAALRFTPDDLAANQAGELGADQRARLAKSERRALLIVVALVVSVAVGATLLLYLGGENNSPVLSVVGISLTALNAVILAIGGGGRLRMRDDLTTGRVEALTGNVGRVVRVQGRIVTYVLTVESDTGVQRFNVPRATFNAFVDGARYRLYRTARARTLIAAERV